MSPILSPPRRARSQRWAFAAAAAAVALSLATPGAALEVRVKGAAQLKMQARFVRDAAPGDPLPLEVRGRLADEADLPISEAKVILKSSTLPKREELTGCQGVPGSVAVADGSLTLHTSRDGEICFRWQQAPATGSLRLRFAGDDYHAATSRDIAFDRSKAQRLATRLRFDPRPLPIDLGKSEQSFSLIFDLALGDAFAVRQDLPIKLFDERDQLLASGVTGGDGKCRLQLPSSKFDAPGSGRLRAEFAGNDALEPARDEHTITRYSSVALGLDEQPGAADPGDRVELNVSVSSPRGVVDGGVVEATSGGASLGSASVKDGLAELEIVLDATLREALPVQLHYLPATPYYRFNDAAALRFEIPIAPPSIWARLLLSLVVLAGAAWVLLSWRRSRVPPTPAAGKLMLAPGVHVVASRRGETGWRGTVLDAHDGNPIAGANVRVTAPSLEDDGVLVEISSDERGRFAFELATRPDSAEIAAQADSHSEQRRALPPAGTLRIALITRRRALLQRFVAWARIRGAPYDMAPEPTPAHVLRMAEGREDVSAWARQMEAAAFADGEVDRAREEAIRAAEPGPDKG